MALYAPSRMGRTRLLNLIVGRLLVDMETIGVDNITIQQLLLISART